MGLVHIVWPTVVTEGTSVTGALIYATTRDGVTFTPRTRVSTLGGPKPTHPQIPVDGTGRTFMAWEEARAGDRQALVRAMERGCDGRVTLRPVTTLGTRESSVYPVLAATSRGMLAVWTERSTGVSQIGVHRLANVRPDSP